MFQNLRPFILLIFLALVFQTQAKIRASSSVRAGSWTTSYDKALKVSKKTGKPMYVLFTGSDWCTYCIQLEKNILKKREWKKIAKKDLILVYIDFPHQKKQRKKIKKQNEKLKKEYGISGYPTSFLVSGDKKVPFYPKKYEMKEFIKVFKIAYNKITQKKVVQK